MYADNVVLFISPRIQDLVTTKGILSLFGDCSGLRTNLDKSLIAPIACFEAEVERARDILQAQVAGFPIQYLGLLLSIGRLRKAHLQPLVDKVSAGLPTWRAQLMNKVGRLTTVKVVMSSKCVHTILAIKIPEWMFKEIDKRRRGSSRPARKPHLAASDCLPSTGVRGPGDSRPTHSSLFPPLVLALAATY